jgi:hypothetical protein
MISRSTRNNTSVSAILIISSVAATTDPLGLGAPLVCQGTSGNTVPRTVTSRKGTMPDRSGSALMPVILSSRCGICR